MAGAGALQRGRDAFRDRAWGDAAARLSAADDEAPLALDDLEHLAIAAYLCGRDPDSEAAWTRAHQESVQAADWARAARCAFWLGITLMNLSQPAKGAGWLGRAQRVLDENDHDCAERGWVLIPVGIQLHHKGDFSASADVLGRAGMIGASHGDTDLVTTARQAQGRALISNGETDRGLALLDEAMVAVAAGEVSPIPAGIIYCSVIEACQQILDVRRAREWTAALTAWCDAQPDLVPYRGRCLIHRSEIMQLNGEWPDALDEARRACERLADPLQPQLGAAFYQRGELHRLRGEFDRADEAYREGAERGRTPEPGRALLRLAQGRVDAASASIRRALDETTAPVPRTTMLFAAVEIMLAQGDVAAARAAADELIAITAAMDVPLLTGLAAHALGAVLLAEGDASAALGAVRSARDAWADLHVPYETARAGIVVGLACRALGDEDTARLELDAARRALTQLGATPELARLKALTGTAATTAGGLSAREAEVLALVAAGRSNRQIAEDLVIAERTVARHMSNIFTKLGVSSRTAASAFAHEHDLV